MPCLARIVTNELKLPFGDGKHYFYMESACGNAADDTVCPKCSSRKLDHGFVKDILPSASHIFDSPWYLKKVATYGLPSKENLEQAMEAQKKARAGKKVSVVHSASSSSLSSSSASASVSVSESASVTSTPKKRAVKPKTIPVASSNVVEQLTYPVIQKISADAKQIESTDEPIRLEGVTRIVIRPFTHNDVTYWRDSEREKIYRRMKDGRRGEYLGRWDSRLEQIVKDAPDSDAD